MSWSYDDSAKVWRCTSYADLQYAEINNFAEYGQPVSPYEPGYNHDHVPDFGNIVIEMPQSEVMNVGYGCNITALDFPLVNHFLDNGVLTGDTAYMPQFVERGADSVLALVGALPRLRTGRHRLGDLINRRQVRNADRFISTTFYGLGSYGLTAGSISRADAAYIHGSVSFALTRNTVFVVSAKERRVEAEIGAGDDNWDFKSDNVAASLNVAVGTIFGPDHYNLTDSIKIHFRGPGKRIDAWKKL